MSKTIKLIVSYHQLLKPVLKSQILIPIQTGRALAPATFDEMIGDDTGDNISHYNPSYSELSAQYWAWKNYSTLGNPNYVGFMHHRRHFLFNESLPIPFKKPWIPNSSVFIFPYFSNNYYNYIADHHIQAQLTNTDCIVSKLYNLEGVSAESCRHQFCILTHEHPSTFDLFIQVAKEKAPAHYAEAIEKIEHGREQYLCNMFVMRKELFFEYSELCFSILEEVRKRSKAPQGLNPRARYLGFLGEFLLSLYVFDLEKRDNIKIKNLNMSYFQPSTLSGVKVTKNNFWATWRYKLLSQITWGKRKKRYLQKSFKY